MPSIGMPSARPALSLCTVSKACAGRGEGRPSIGMQNTPALSLCTVSNVCIPGRRLQGGRPAQEPLGLLHARLLADFRGGQPHCAIHHSPNDAWESELHAGLLAPGLNAEGKAARASWKARERQGRASPG